MDPYWGRGGDPYEYVIVYPAEDIDPTYIEPSRRGRYHPETNYLSGLNHYEYGASHVLQSPLRSDYDIDLRSVEPESSSASYYDDYLNKHPASSRYSSLYPRYERPSSARSYDDIRRPTYDSYPKARSYDTDSLSVPASRDLTSLPTPRDYSSIPSSYDYSPMPTSRDYSSMVGSRDPKPKDKLISSSLSFMDTQKELSKTDEAYLEKMMHILSAYPIVGVPSDPSNILGNIYVGTSANAENPDLIKRMGITHLLNCGAKRKLLARNRKGNPHGPEVGIKDYEEMYIEDSENFDILSYLPMAHNFIDRAKGLDANVLVYDSGVSRSGAICLSYMIRSGIPLLASVKKLKAKRRVALCNTGFMKQLVAFARERDMLDDNMKTIRATKFGGPRDRYRLITAHLPTFL